MLFEQKRGQTNVTSLVERVSRFTVILKTPNQRTKPVMGKIMKAIKDLPHIARRSITFDRGSEFVSWPQLQAKIGTQLGSALPRHQGKKERLKTPIEGLEDGSPASVISGSSRITISRKSATASTTRRANA